MAFARFARDMGCDRRNSSVWGDLGDRRNSSVWGDSGDRLDSGVGGIWGVNDGCWRAGSMPLTPTVFIVVLITQLLTPTLLNTALLDGTRLSDDRRVGLTGQ